MSRPPWHPLGSPISQGTLATTGTRDSDERVPLAQGAHRLKVLVIDDSGTARTAISNALRLAGFRVFELPSAIGATRMAVRERMDAAVVDISMPGLSGDKLVGVFRSNLQLNSMAIIVVSGQAEEQLQEVAKNPGVDGVLPKSQIQSELASMLTRLVATRRAAAP